MPCTGASEIESSVDTARSEQINATAFQRYLTLLAIKLLKRFRKRNGTVLFLSKNVCVKYGSNISLSEASSIQFAAKYTLVPVPRRIHGDPVGLGWLKRLEESWVKILHQLKDMVGEMRRIIPLIGIGVAYVDGGPLHNPWLPGTLNSFGPFKTVQDFHRHLRGGFEAHLVHKLEISELILQQDKLQSALVFTYGDLSSLNVLASGDKVVGIINWETAGWYPSYWEYTTA
ncbi:hypothetical protein P154DRAFT_606910 [Amniculicola lignicola CBS 123094]|uniref:Aminoglycoside phosphotransferase domain-containing protein n=1 Tax=Amniculicola lignicola CBS 123094 TaxID=1392246 RepID=A0A6A5W899_9PLEO|nr:hypothetical protein P154DRAFT_606910 [Amniculicola lignicola CBS 123094]